MRPASIGSAPGRGVYGVYILLFVDTLKDKAPFGLRANGWNILQRREMRILSRNSLLHNPLEHGHPSSPWPTHSDRTKEATQPVPRASHTRLPPTRCTPQTTPVPATSSTSYGRRQRPQRQEESLINGELTGSPFSPSSIPGPPKLYPGSLASVAWLVCASSIPLPTFLSYPHL